MRAGVWVRPAMVPVGRAEPGGQWPTASGLVLQLEVPLQRLHWRGPSRPRGSGLCPRTGLRKQRLWTFQSRSEPSGPVLCCLACPHLTSLTREAYRASGRGPAQSHSVLDRGLGRLPLLSSWVQVLFLCRAPQACERSPQAGRPGSQSRQRGRRSSWTHEPGWTGVLGELCRGHGPNTCVSPLCGGGWTAVDPQGTPPSAGPEWTLAVPWVAALVNRSVIPS